MSKIRLHGSSSGYTEIAPVAASGNNTLTLPNDGTIISKDSAGAVGVTSVVTDTIKVGAAVTIGESGVNVVGVVTATSGIVGLTSTGLPAGSIVQVVTTNKTDTASSSAAGGGETGQFMSATIKPTSSSNKVLIIINANFGGNQELNISLRIWKNDATPSAGTLNGDSAGNRRYVGSSNYLSANNTMTNIHYSYLDSPSTTSAIKYGFVALHQSGSTKTITLNGAETDSDATTQHRAISSITLMEVAV